MTSLIIFERFKIKICGTYCDDGCDTGFPLQVFAQLRRCHQFENFTNPGYDKAFNELFQVSLNKTKMSYSTNIKQIAVQFNVSLSVCLSVLCVASPSRIFVRMYHLKDSALTMIIFTSR